MTIGTFPVSNVLKTYTRVMKNRTAQRGGQRDESLEKDVVTISLEGKRKQVMDFATREIIQKVKDTE